MIPSFVEGEMNDFRSQ